MPLLHTALSCPTHILANLMYLQVLVLQHLVIRQLKPSIEMIIGEIVAATRHIDKFGMSHLVTHEVHEGLTAQPDGAEPDHLVKRQAPTDRVALRRRDKVITSARVRIFFGLAFKN